MSQGTQTGPLYQPRMVGWGGRFKRLMYVYLQLIHVDVGQKTTKFCKAIILQLKNKHIFKKAKKILDSSLSMGDNPNTSERHLTNYLHLLYLFI